MTLPARSIPADALLQELRRLGIKTVVSVPDTHQKSLLAALDRVNDIRVVTCCTEDEAVTLGAGLWIGGEPFVLMIQHAGLYACVNHLRGVGLDLKVPLLMMVGLLGRELDKSPRENSGSMNRLAEPLLDALGIAHYLMDGPEDIPFMERALNESREREQPVAVFVGAPTS
ncbi:MAG: thiamine pyrophosphate-binding protein [Dehalococcoidia bacterium]